MRLDGVAILFSGAPAQGEVRVSYGRRMPRGEHEVIHGGFVKFTLLNEVFTNALRRFNILYLGSSSLPQNPSYLIGIAKKKGAKIALNQNGVGYPAWAGDNWRRVNEPMREVLHRADYVFYQSRFCRRSADRFLGERSDRWEILYNPVDTDRFRPTSMQPPSRPIMLLHAGSVIRRYRFEVALRTVAELTSIGVDARLFFAGRLVWNHDEAGVAHEVETLLNQYDVRDKITVCSPYSREQAPSVFQSAHMLLHTKLNDPCPTVVLEALASGLPVVYSNSGGVPELVGEEAGIGVPCLTGWDQEVPPDPKDLAQAVVKVARERDTYAQAARQRAVDLFSLRNWVDRHRHVFESLVK